MDLVNATAMTAGYTLGLDPDGRERLVVVAKGTFGIPPKGGSLHLADEQLPLVLADEFYGEPGIAATRIESDYAPTKPLCDILVLGDAHAPDGRPTDRVRVGLRVGTVSKTFDVVGDRVWHGGRITKPRPFVKQPIHYGVAFGGHDSAPDEPDRQEWFTANPIGVGFYPLSRGSALDGRKLPNTEEKGRPIDSTKGPYAPMSFGPLGRNFDPRFRLAGTYDDQWMENSFPFLPPDFDPRYFQAAPVDQQIPHLHGGEEVDLLGLTPEGRTRFALPAMEVPVEFTNAAYTRTTVTAVADTVVIEPSERRVTISWRASQPLRRNILEMRQVAIGRMSRAWYRARELGKTYYPSLAAATRRSTEDDEA